MLSGQKRGFSAENQQLFFLTQSNADLEVHSHYRVGGGSQAMASSTGQISGHLQERLNCAFKGVGIKFCRQEGQHSFVTPLVRTGEVLEEAGQRGSGEDFWDGSRMSVSHIPKKTEDEFSRRPSL